MVYPFIFKDPTPPAIGHLPKIRIAGALTVPELNLDISKDKKYNL